MQTPIANLHKNESTAIKEYLLPDGKPASKILGHKIGYATLTRYNSAYSELTLKVRIPIPLKDGETVQVMLGIKPKFETKEVSTINFASETMNLPARVEVTPLNTKGNVIAYYGNGEAFLATEPSTFKVKITYLNFYPIIESIKNSSTILYEKLGTITRKILGGLSTYTFKTEPINAGNTAAFQEAYIQGSITGECDSIIIRVKGNESLNIITDEKPINLPENLSNISPMKFEKGSFKADLMKIVPGKAFYINATLQNVILNLEGKPTKLIMSLKDGNAYTLSGSTITLKAKSLTVLLRKPQIKVNGTGLFTNLYTYHDLHKRTRASGVDCKIEGHFAFTGAYGDTYTIAKNFDYDGKVNLPKPLYEFDELKALKETIPYLFILAFCYITFLVIKTGGKENHR